MDRIMIWLAILLILALIVGIFCNLTPDAFADFVDIELISEDDISVNDDVDLILEDDPTPEPTEETTQERTPEPTAEASPEPTVEPTPDAYQTELLTHIGNIEGFLIFFCVVIICYFAYRFIRIFI